RAVAVRAAVDRGEAASFDGIAGGCIECVLLDDVPVTDRRGGHAVRAAEQQNEECDDPTGSESQPTLPRFHACLLVRCRRTRAPGACVSERVVRRCRRRAPACTTIIAEAAGVTNFLRGGISR